MRLSSCLAQAMRPAMGGRFRDVVGLVFSDWYIRRTCSRSCPYDNNSFVYLAATSN